MFHLTLFGGTEGEIAPAGFTAVTAFGAAELRRPTLASQLMYLRSRGQRRLSRWKSLLGTDKNLILTLFGGTVLQAPTLVEEYSALMGVMRSRVLAADDCAHLLEQLIAEGGEVNSCRTLTLFGVCETRYPSVGKERKALDAAAKTGSVTTRIRGMLEEIVGAPPQARVRALGQLAMAPAT